ncbi:right-handed parallel beta-helix repeat-containing protein [Ruficoccus amylovorans]|uniref:Right-handed parallel beta-helix repeat-containing protein n=1 Tax=Ruficoccus amylovorans TaxID=1804625 RepID=A0A842HFC7_9BACT|nr:right-handed parallel beta-helix repeat-containing protein [Ruficoccus amylovorans]MBC2595223.1 right-handed parallel beta-helix repeat-containing protein [Ruficoccus amylovorans]
MPVASAQVDISTLGVKPGDATDNTENLQRVLNEGPGMLFFPAGTYRTGTVEVPANRTLIFDPEAVVQPVADKVKDKNLFVVTGNDVQFRGLHYDFADGGKDVNETAVWNLVYADGVSNLVVSEADVGNTDERGLVPLKERKRRGRLLNRDGSDPAKKYNHNGYYNSQVLLWVVNCRDVVLENSKGFRLHAMLHATSSANVTARGNHMVSGNYMTKFLEGSENLRHHDNWSRDVKYQVCWFGGSPDPSRKPYLPRGSSTVAKREVKPGESGYNPHTSGAFDVLVQNNYAEYGNTLAWGNKGRQVVIDSNIARFISDYAYGSEGGENLVFSNNISINSTAGGIVSMYWGEKLLITGNLIMVRHEPWEEEWSWWDSPAKYLGPFVRLHHGPSNEGDMYGSGTVMITGNLFSNELSTRTTDISIQAGRDVTVSGNKFINGRVNKFGPGKVTVMDNEFVSRLEYDPLSVNIMPRGSDMVIVKGNIFRQEAPIMPTDEQLASSEASKVPYFLFTDDDPNAEAEEGAVTGDMPAISIEANGPFFGLVEDNAIYGWIDAISGQIRSNVAGASILVLKNTTDGIITVDSSNPKSTALVENNTEIPAGLMPQ